MPNRYFIKSYQLHCVLMLKPNSPLFYKVYNNVSKLYDHNDMHKAP